MFQNFSIDPDEEKITYKPSNCMCRRIQFTCPPKEQKIINIDYAGCCMNKDDEDNDDFLYEPESEYETSWPINICKNSILKVSNSIFIC